MECASDTESDSSGPLSPGTITESIKECAVLQKANPRVLSFEAVERAIEILGARDVALSSIVEDKSQFQESSELLLGFLDRVSQYAGTEHVPEVTHIFSQLGSHSFLQRLLNLRKYVRLAERAPGSQLIVVTWIDAVLARLTYLATRLAACDLEKEAEWIRLRREDDTIRAATQLPDHWTAMVAVIGSKNFSPAARRLATSLCFIAYIMVRQIASDKTWPREGPLPLDMLHSLYLSINQSACASSSPSVLRSSSVDKVQLAMFVSLFAGAHSHTDPGDITYTSHLRPEGFGHILEIIQVILGQSDPSLRVLEKPDSAQYLLLRWGNIVTWSWSTWNDQRVANTECLRSLSATWFLLVHAATPGTTPEPLDRRISGIDLQSTLLSDVFSSSLIVLQLLREILDEKNRKLIPHSVTTRILCKLCWASVQYLEANILKENPRFEGLIPELCNSLILLFPVINVHEEEDNLVRISIVEALALMPIKVLSSSLKKILQGKQFLSDIDESMRCCIRLLSDQSDKKRDQEISSHFAKSLLNFSSLLQSSIDDHNLQRTISSFVVYISQLMLEGDRPSLIAINLAPLLTVLSVLQSKKPETVKINEDIWMLTTQSLTQHLSVPAAFAYYLLTTSAHHCDPLLRHEAWNYLLGALTKILERQLPEEEEPLALLVCPNICLALRSVSCSGAIRSCLWASPWALTLRLSMRELLDNETRKEPYFRQLRERIRSEGLKLVNEVSYLRTISDSCEGKKLCDPDAHPMKPRLVYHRDCYQAELIPVYDLEG